MFLSGTQIFVQLVHCSPLKSRVGALWCPSTGSFEESRFLGLLWVYKIWNMILDMIWVVVGLLHLKLSFRTSNLFRKFSDFNAVRSSDVLHCNPLRFKTFVLVELPNASLMDYGQSFFGNFLLLGHPVQTARCKSICTLSRK